MKALLAVCLLAMVRVSAAIGKFRLPGKVMPRHYDLMFTYDLDPATNFSFYGVAHILINAKEKTSKIVLHAEDFSVSEDNVNITAAGQRKSPKVKGVERNKEFNFLTVNLEEDLRTGATYVLTIPFYGNLKPGLDGVYISSYKDKKTGVVEYLIATQFEAISARKGFPCFDEPLAKATFKMIIGHHKNYTAASNMPLENSTTENELKKHWPTDEIEKTFKKDMSEFVWDRFNKSVPMSTYLVAYVVSKFEFVESHSGETTFRIWTRKDAMSQTGYAAKIGPQVLTYYEQYFNVSFPLPKIDMFAIPDFNAGAMENWGLITYKESALLFDEVQSTLLNKGKVAELIAHELAHQWFGNLVTMKWWADLWLNEGFATYVSYVGVAAVEPEWMHNLTHSLEDLLVVSNADALKSSHPVSTTLEDPKQILAMFDPISYKKGATLIRMMNMLMGEDKFRAALNNYLIKYSYANAEQDDLWREFSLISKDSKILKSASIKEIMDTWTKQTGYPLVTVKRNYGKKSMLVTQTRYFALLTTRADTTWWVPLSVLTEALVASPGNRSVLWLTVQGRQQTIDLDTDDNSWVMVNYDMIAPMRVNYDPRNWELITNYINSPKCMTIPVTARVQLISDALELAWTEKIDYATALKLVSYLQMETDYIPISTAIQGLAKIEDVLKRTADYGAFQKYGRRLIEKTYNKVAECWDGPSTKNNDILRVRLEVLTVRWACRMQVVGCEENAIALFKKWMEADDPDSYNPIPLDLRRVVYCVAISRGGVVEWRFAAARKQFTNVAAARDALVYGLTCTKKVWLLQTLLQWILDKNAELRPHEATSVLMGILKSSVGYYVARDFVYSRIKELHEAYTGQLNKFGFVMMSILTQFNSQTELDEFTEWSEKNKQFLESSDQLVKQGIEKAKVNIYWMDKNSKKVVEKMREYSSDYEDPVCKILKGKGITRSDAFRYQEHTLWITALIFLLILR